METSSSLFSLNVGFEVFGEFLDTEARVTSPSAVSNIEVPFRVHGKCLYIAPVAS